MFRDLRSIPSSMQSVARLSDASVASVRRGPVEALAAGRPVVALGKGGTAETVIDGVTGVHFHEQTVEAVMEAIQRAEKMDWDTAVIQESAEKFSEEAFRNALRALAEGLVARG